MAARARAAGHAVELVDATAAGPGVLAGAAAAILCVPVHAGRYPAALVHLARDRAPRLNALPSAFVSVSLAIIGEEAVRREAVRGRLFAESGWTPRAVHRAAGVLRFSEYDFFRRWVIPVSA